MATVETKEWIEERLRAADPDIDLTEGSPWQEQVVEAVVRRYTPDPFEMDLEKFISTRLSQEFPTLNTREGSGLIDGIVKPANILLDPIIREVQVMKQNQSLADPAILSPSDADSLVANLFVSRDTGGLSTGTVRAYFNAPVALNISVNNVAYTSSGLRFIPTSLQSITAEAMIFNSEGGLYYFDIQYTAERAGTEYNIAKDDIVGITNLTVAVRVTNRERFTDGIAEQSTDELVQEAEESITERSLVVARGVSARLRAEFNSMTHLQVVGMSDEEMERDVIVGGDLGPVLLYGNDGYSVDDGRGGSSTTHLRTRNGNFLSVFGAAGVLADPYYVYLTSVDYGDDAEVPSLYLNRIKIDSYDFMATDVGRTFTVVSAANGANVGPVEILQLYGSHEIKVDRTGVAETDVAWMLPRVIGMVEVAEVISASELKLATAIPADHPMIAWSIHKKALTLSEIPGGIVSEADRGVLEYQSDEIHIGGASDFYVRAVEVEEQESIIESITDETPLVYALTLQKTAAAGEFVRDVTKDFVALGVKVGHSVVIEEGVDAGTKTVLRVGRSPTGTDDPTYLQVYPAITSTESDLRYRIIDDIDINLREPKTVRGSGLDLQTIQLSDTVTTTSAVDFDALGAEEGDTLELLGGLDKGEYSIEGISGTGNRYLQLGSTMRSTAYNIAWQLYKSQEGIDFPLVRIRSIDILDSSNQPSGDTIPYSEPVDSQSTAFSNAGRGTKVSTTDAIVGIVGTKDLSDTGIYPLAPTIVDFSINDGATQSVTLSTSANAQEIVNRINAEISNIADLMEVDGETRLVIRSTDRWIKVLPDGMNANVGLDTSGEDNRQIKSDGNISDWSSSAYDLKVQKDSVYIMSGDSIGFHYLVEVTANKLYAVGFDEEDGQVRFLQPGVRVTVRAGSRSYGKARVYFLDPTSFEVRGAWRPPLKSSDTHPANAAITIEDILEDEQPITYFTATINGAELRFVPDPELKHQVIPHSAEDAPNNLYVSDPAADPLATIWPVESEYTPAGDLGKGSRDVELDFLRREIAPGDLLEITHQPIQGSYDLEILAYQPAPDLAGKTLILSLDGAPRKTMTFSDQLASSADVVSEINSAFGTVVAYLETIGAVKYLRLEADVDIIVHKDGTANGGTSPAALLGLSTSANTNNRAASETDGYYTIVDVSEAGDPTQHQVLQISPKPLAGGQSQHFKVFRSGVQRIHSTDMNDNQETGLYYMDVELISEGPGDEWNLPQGEKFEIEGHKSDGYKFEVADKDLTYSEEEDLNIVLSRRILTVGQSDNPEEAQTLSNLNLQINYDRSPLTASIQSFASSELERVLCASLLVRHLQPHYLNFDMAYRGGSSADIVEGDVIEYLENLGPDERVEASDLGEIPRRRGATYVQNPINLVAVVHDEERRISVERSQDYVTHGRLATFFIGNIQITREIPSVF
jgi:hypothetical protein